MASRSVELFSALYSTLSTDAPLTALIDIGQVFDYPLTGAQPPYVVIGDETAINDGSDLVDAQEHTITIHVWSEQQSTLEAKRIIQAVRNALHMQRPTMSAGRIVNLRNEHQEIMRDPDGVSIHGVMRFRAVVTS